MTTACSRLVCRKLHYPLADSIEDRKTLFRNALRELFEPLGCTEIFIPDKNRKHYAVVSFPNTNIANEALSSVSVPHSLFDELKEMANNHSPRGKSERPSQKEKLHYQTVTGLKNIMNTGGVDFIIQCTRSHADRIEEVCTCLDGDRSVRVSGIHHIKDVSLLFCEARSARSVIGDLYSRWYIQDNIQRIFMLRDTCGEQPYAESSTPLYFSQLPNGNDIAELLAFEAKRDKSKEERHLIRVQVYPPRIHSQVLEGLESVIQSSALEGFCSCTPDRTAATHVLCVLELVAQSETNASNGFCVMAYVPQCSPRTGKASPPTVGRATCRAYWKLAEAVDRYTSVLPSSSHGHGVDVGASPGGWTQYLIQSQNLSRVYSIDPGDLDPFVLSLQSTMVSGTGKRKLVPAVRHIRSTYSIAISQIAQERRGADRSSTNMVDDPVQWYVSDMCVKTLGEQIDALLLAARLALVGSKTFLVVTLKCTRGYSKASFDAQVAQQVDRIRPHVTNLQVFHLFSNRPSERTIVGYWI